MLFGYFAWKSGSISADEGYAVAGDFKQLKSDVVDIRIGILTNNIQTAQERVCAGLVNENRQAVRYAVERRQRLTDQYHEIAGRDFDLPTCQELGIVKQ